ncbi:Methionine--tRNA ligase [Planctomycetes bacterium Pla163]|uniref:Methionine--tRNA ligase n=1 Tax=Rohdeia mirabilis TaxID=2528008 RepID=A0A518D2E3_9BACT|nr:Methionine--tRNA ligase [Planctomycetes bacterium Pla163]
MGSTDADGALLDFERVDVRVGTVARCEAFPEGRYSTHVLWIDLGAELGRMKSLARLVHYGDPSALVGRQVLCLVGLEPRQIGSHTSQVLTLAVPDANGDAVLVVPDPNAAGGDVPAGGRLF